MNKQNHTTAAKPDEIESSLKAIYKDEGGKIPDLTKLEPKKNRWWAYALIAGIIFVSALIGAAWAGFSFFKPFRGFTGQGLEIRIEGPESVSLGQETTYFINYRNRTSEPIAAAQLRVSFPSDFAAEATDPMPTGDGLSWKLGALPVEGSGTITVRGVFTGALGTTTAVQVVGSYRPGSFNSDFEALATKVIRYENSVLSGMLAVPSKALPGDRIALVYSVKNDGKEQIEGLEARMTLPEGFQIDATSTEGSLEGRVWRVPLQTLSEGASTTIRLYGRFASGVSGEAHVIAEAGRVSKEGAFLPSQRAETSFTVLAGDLSLKLVVNGSDKDMAINYGSPLRFGIAYENTSSEDLRDVSLKLRFEAVTSTETRDPVDWSSIQDSASGTRKGKTVTWDKNRIAAFKRLPSHEDGFIDLSAMGVKSDAGSETLGMRVVLEAQIGGVGSDTVNRTVQTAPLTLRYMTDATIGSEARYSSEEGATVGSGPLPPVVGKETTYRIQWTVDKHFHELKDMKFSAVLPKIATWADGVLVDAGEVVYDEKTRTVRWTLNRMPADIGSVEADFFVKIAPTEADANRFAQLLGETKFDATDAETATTFAFTHPALTTDLQNDEFAEGKGVVRSYE